MNEVLQRLFTGYTGVLIATGVAIAYLLLFQIAIGDLAIGGRGGPAALVVAPDWPGLLFRERAPFQFEAVAIVEAPLFVWLISPLNIAIGLALGLLTGLQVALVRVTRQCATACGLSPATGLLASLPGLLAGSACCAPLLLLLLGIQVTASLVTLMGLMIPAAFLFLSIGLVATARIAVRRCAVLRI